jgi:hypothetical protein
MTSIIWITILGISSLAGEFGVFLAIQGYWIYILFSPSAYEVVQNEQKINLPYPFFTGLPIVEDLIHFTYQTVRVSYLYGNGLAFYIGRLK